MILQTQLYIWLINDLLSALFPILVIIHLFIAKKAMCTVVVKRSDKERPGV
jgi:hypothetical protein